MAEPQSEPAWRRCLAPVVAHLPRRAESGLRKARVAAHAARTAARRFDQTQAVTPEMPHPRLGLVERFDYRHIAGWVTDDAAELPARVTLHVNGLQVAATWAGEPSTHNVYAQARTFHFVLRDLWQYCCRADRVTVRLDGVPLPISRKGMFKSPPSRGAHSLDDLRAKLDDGFVFNQRGRLQLSKQLDTAWQAAVLSLYHRVSAVVAREFGHDPFLIYGSLLGYVREGGFIGHDVDFDAAYLSAHTDPALAAAELRDIALCLVDAGFEVECKVTALHIRDVSDPSLRIDLFHLLFDEHDTLQAPFGVVSSTPFPRSQWDGLVDGELGGHVVTVPASARALAAHIYGPAWQVPVAGFNWDRERRASYEPAHTLPEYREEVYWANFYARHELADGSSFFDAVSARDDVPSTVLDIGCGDGRDSFAFARRGSRVHGIDRSQVGIRHASQSATAAGLGDLLSFGAVDVADASHVRETIASLRSASGDGPVLFYARFFLHSIPEDVQETVLQALADSAIEGDMLAVEFRTEADAETKKVYGGHYRRYQDGAAFGRDLRERFGFADVRLEIESAGLAPYKDEDPIVYRVLALRAGAPSGA